VRAVAQLLGAPDALVYKVPTADLESLVPGKPDEDAFGVTYEQIDDFPRRQAGVGRRRARSFFRRTGRAPTSARCRSSRSPPRPADAKATGFDAPMARGAATAAGTIFWRRVCRAASDRCMLGACVRQLSGVNA
jgi:hypothetical protein